MNLRATRLLALAGIAGLLCAPGLQAQTPLGTAFTYQGRLTDSGVPPTGAFDLQFRLFDAPTTGNTVGSTITLPTVVTDGHFTVRLDFGASAFTGSARWLEIGLRPTGGPPPNLFTILSPRQELTPVPDSVFSATAPWTGVTGKPAGFADGVDNDSGGDITGVTAGTGLTGGGSAGDVNLAVNTTIIQSRVTGSCAPGTAIRVVAENGNVTCQADATGNDWTLLGNAGTNPATNFIGTIDNQAFELRVNNLRGLRIEPPATTGAFQGSNVVLGYASNSVGAGAQGAVVAGGGLSGGPPSPNRATGHFGTVGGGINNRAGDLDADPVTGYFATVGGGQNNTASGSYATLGGGFLSTASGHAATVGGGSTNAASGSVAIVGGGDGNTASGGYASVGGGHSNTASAASATVSGGELNTASHIYAAVGGGQFNTATNQYATVPGGRSNQAGGHSSFAAGNRAKVRDATQSSDSDGDEGTFVWADSTFGDFISAGPNQFLIRATGGVAVNTNTPALNTALTVSGNTAVTGNVGIGTTSPGALLQVGDLNTPNSQGMIRLASHSGTGASQRHWDIGVPEGDEDVTGKFYSFVIDDPLVGTEPEVVVRWDTGNVGIGRVPTANNKLEVEGTASKTTAGDWLANSDRRLKTDIRGIEGALEVIGKLRPVQFRYTEAFRSKHPSVKDMTFYNYVAQEFQQVFPDSVQEGEDGYLQVDTHNANVYAVRAVQELHRIVKDKDAEIAAQEARLRMLEARLAELEGARGTSTRAGLR